MDSQAKIKEIVSSHPVVLFMKGTAQFPQCGFSGNAINILKAAGVEDLHTVNVFDDEGIRQGIKQFANWPTIPQLYINGEFVGCLLYTSPSPRDGLLSRMPSSA